MDTRTIRVEMSKARFRTIDGRVIAAMYAEERGRAAVVLIPSDASRWEATVAARVVTERAKDRRSVYEKVFLDELLPEPRLA